MAQVEVEDKPLTPTPTAQQQPNTDTRRKRILVVNDDGVKSLGLKQLAIALEDIGDVVVVSTIDNQIHPSFSITIQEQIRAKMFDVWGQNISVYAVSGFPMNCLKYAYGHVIPNILKWDELDLVIAGINKGRNVGTDLLYSGTMSLACAARFGNESFMKHNKTPKAIAISLCPPSMSSTSALALSNFADWNFEDAVKAAKQVAVLALESEQTPNVVWNVNIPQTVLKSPFASNDDIYYWAVTKPARLNYNPSNLITITKEEEKSNYADFVINGPETMTKEHDVCGSDLYALKHNIISISPIEVAPELHTPLHATHNLINYMTQNKQLFYCDSRYFWNINANIRPLESIVQCMKYWLDLKEQNEQNEKNEEIIYDNDAVLLHTYTLYLQRDIKICAAKDKFAGILIKFGWSANLEKFNETLTWKELRDLYAVLSSIQSKDRMKHDTKEFGYKRMILKGGLIAGSVMGLVGIANLFGKKTRQYNKNEH